MSTGRNTATVKAFYTCAFNDGQPAEAIRQFADPGYVQYGPMTVGGTKAFIEYFEGLARECPGKRVELRRVIAEGDFVVLQVHHYWPNGDVCDGIDIFRLNANARIVEHWGVIDRMPEPSPRLKRVLSFREKSQ
jgi:predicted SnoaL-like aldol condensation-catalyzing enzyme